MFGGCSGSILPSIKLTLQWLISVSNQIQIQIIGVKAGDGLMLGWAENISNWLAFSRSCWHLVGKWVSSVERRHQLCSRLERQSVPKTMPFNWCQPWRVYLQLQLYFLSPFPLFFLFFYLFPALNPHLFAYMRYPKSLISEPATANIKLPERRLKILGIGI